MGFYVICVNGYLLKKKKGKIDGETKNRYQSYVAAGSLVEGSVSSFIFAFELISSVSFQFLTIVYFYS